MKPTPKKKQPVKARKMYVHPARLEPKHELVVMRKRNFDAGTDGIKPLPVFVIDGSQEAYDAMVEQMARGMYANERRYESKKMTWETTWQAVRNGYLKDARASLRAINITPPTK